MKVNKKNSEVFKPFTLEITIETLEELNELYARMNASRGSIEDAVFDSELEWAWHSFNGLFCCIKEECNHQL